jgi:sulfur-carrier protein adenylyltransferase/sulfurtransferase
MPVPEISVQEAYQRLQGEQPPLLVDVREQNEWDHANIEDSVLVPLSVFPERSAESLRDKSAPLLMLCHHGMRSAHATAYLLSQGYEDVTNVAGGIDAWSVEVDASIPRY